MSIDPDRIEKIRRLLNGLSSDPDGLELLRTTLFEAGHRVMPRVEFMSLPSVEDPERLANAREGVVLDVETTGLTPGEDKVIQLSMLKIKYDAQGILAIGDMFDAYQDPGFPIPEEITRITGITDEMVKGKTITEQEIATFLTDIDMAVAHNASFDRKFVEASFPGAGFQEIDWHCSIEQIDWKARGEGKAGLEMLALNAGFVYDAHNSRSDILATAFILAKDGPDGRPSAFVEMLEEASNAPHHLIAKGSSFHMKELLKERGYRWCDDKGGENVCGHTKVWHRIIPGTPEGMAAEAEFIESIYNRPVMLPLYAYDGKTRYSERPAARVEDFCTQANLTLWEKLQLDKDAPCRILNRQGTFDI